MRWPGWIWFLACTAWLASGAWAGDGAKSGRPALGMSTAVVCKKIIGYEDYVELPDASLTSEDKLNIYLRPLNFRVVPVEKPRPGHRFQARFVEDCRIRVKGEKKVLQKKDRLLEYDAFFEAPNELLYLVNNISLKELAPGDYELDIVLHDDLEKDISATQTVSFKVVPIAKAETPSKAEGADEPVSPPAPAPARDSKKSRKTSKTKP